MPLLAVRGHDAERDEQVRVRLANLEAGGQAVAEGIDRLDDMVGGDDGKDGLRVILGENGCGEADGVGGVARFGLTEQVVLRQLRQVGEDGLAVLLAGADVDLLGRQGVEESVEAEAEQALALGDGQELLGRVAAGERPEPFAAAAGHDDAVSHDSWWKKEQVRLVSRDPARATGRPR